MIKMLSAALCSSLASLARHGDVWRVFPLVAAMSLGLGLPATGVAASTMPYPSVRQSADATPPARLQPVGQVSVVHAAVVITSVIVTGDVMSPTLTIRGTGFGASAPAANPSTTPAGHTAPGITYTCPSTRGKDGLDYGSSGLWLLDHSTTGFSAGRYDVSLDELDCIGVVILSYAPHQIRLRLGAAYRQFGLGKTYTWSLNPGDSFTLDVKDVTYNGTVVYRP